VVKPMDEVMWWSHADAPGTVLLFWYIMICRANMGGVDTRVKSTVYVINKRYQRKFVGYVC
jgi:hypothetical protein